MTSTVSPKVIADSVERSGATVATQNGLDTAEKVLSRFGFTSGMIIQEFGYDTDVDQSLRDGIEELTGEDLVDEDYGDVTDAALLWFRDGDDDLTDLLVDVQSLLDAGGPVWLLLPKAGRDGHVSPQEVQEAASLAGLHVTSSFVANADWTATQLVEKGHSK